jgi:histidinol dehydrogenase
MLGDFLSDARVAPRHNAVERGGDRAVLRYTKQFDRVTLKPTSVRVTAEEIKDAQSVAGWFCFLGTSPAGNEAGT